MLSLGRAARRALTGFLLVPALVLGGLLALSSPAEAAVRKCSPWVESDEHAYVAVRVCVTVARPTSTTVRITSVGYFKEFYADARNVDGKMSVRKNSGASTSVLRSVTTRKNSVKPVVMGRVSKVYQGAHGRAEGRAFVTGQWTIAGGGDWHQLRLGATKSFRY